MTIEELKTSIETKTIGDDLILFQYEDVPFIADQYIREISKIRGLPISYIDSLDALTSSTVDIFGMAEADDSIRVFRTKEIESISDKIKFEKNLFIVFSKIKESKCLSVFDNVVTVPKLENWQLRDYMYSVVEGIDQKDLDWLITSCNEDIYRLENELDKFRLFSENERKYLFNDMKFDGAFSDLSSVNVFNITNALTSRDMNTLKNAIREIESFDAEPLGVVTLLYQGFKKLIQVWLAKQPTPENTGLRANVIYAINKQQRVFNKDQLLKSFILLTGVDKELKTGNLDTKWLIDYLVCRILTY